MDDVTYGGRRAELDALSRDEHIDMIMRLQDQFAIAHDLMLSVRERQLVLTYDGRTAVIDELVVPYPLAMIIMQSVHLLQPEDVDQDDV